MTLIDFQNIREKSNVTIVTTDVVDMVDIVDAHSDFELFFSLSVLYKCDCYLKLIELCRTSTVGLSVGRIRQ